MRSMSARTRAFVVFLVMSLAMTMVAGAGAVSASEDPPPYDPDHVLVGFHPGVTAAERAAVHAEMNGRLDNRMDWADLDVVRVPDGHDPIDVAARYERIPLVDYAHPNWELRATSIPNDNLFNDQWGFHNTGQQTTGSLSPGTPDADIDGPEGWDIAFGAGSFPSSGGTRVGIVDTGIDRSHVDLLGKTVACATANAVIGVIVEGTCSDDNGHGTHVAGTVAAITGNGIGVSGTAPDAELAIFKALNGAGVGFYADVIAGIHWLHTTGGARIVSMSLGGPEDDALKRELSEAYSAGTLLVAAAGNDGDDTLNWPAAHSDVISVAATDDDDEKAWFSNCNADVEIAAPGVNIWSTWPGNAYLAINGTSMATPHVSGVAALVMSEQGLGHTDTRRQLVNTADDLGPSGRDSCFGYGRVNLAGALGALNTTEPAPADPGAIAGTVSDGSTGSGIGGAVVDCGSGYDATTASDGTYSIGTIPAGSYTCTASATGYRSKSQTVTVESNSTTTADFALRPSKNGNGGGGGKSNNGQGKGKPS